jgi:hypothetical protein
MCNTRSTKNENVAHISLKNVFGRQPSFLWAIYAILRKKDSVLQIYRFRYKVGEIFLVLIFSSMKIWMNHSKVLFTIQLFVADDKTFALVFCVL